MSDESEQDSYPRRGESGQEEIDEGNHISYGKEITDRMRHDRELKGLGASLPFSEYIGVALILLLPGVSPSPLAIAPGQQLLSTGVSLELVIIVLFMGVLGGFALIIIFAVIRDPP